MISPQTQYKKMRYKIWAVAVCFCIALLVAWTKAGVLQIKKGRQLLELSTKQAMRKFEVSALRGTIYDRHQNVLASSVYLKSIYAEPNKILDKKKVAKLLCQAIHKPLGFCEKKLFPKKGFIWVQRRVRPQISDAVKALDLEGIGFIDEEKRYYPNHFAMGHVLGSVSVDGEGIGGVEQAFHEVLEGNVDSKSILVDARGDRVHFYPYKNSEFEKGQDITLTLDLPIQHVVEDVLERSVKKHGARAAWAVLMDVRTGDLLSVANVPLINPNTPEKVPMFLRRNRAFSESFEPGSIFKLVTFAAALDKKLISKNTLIDCENGEMQVGAFKVKDVSKQKVITAQDVLHFSSNVGIYKIADKLGKEGLHRAILNLGFGKKIGLGLVEEAPGRISDYEKWGLARFVNVSFGYGIMVSSLQLLAMAATIAREGVYVSPRILLNAPIQEPHRVLSQQAALELGQMMEVSTKEGNFGFRAHTGNIRAAGKSGTAEKVDEKTGKYNKRKNRSSFIGFAPLDKPRLALLVVVDEPQGIAYGGRVAAPAWGEIMTYALQAYE